MARFPKAVGIISVCIAAVWFALSATAWSDAQNLPSQPQNLRLADIAMDLKTRARVWATVSDPVEWDCETLLHETVGQAVHSTIRFNSADREIVVVVETFTEKRSCTDIVKQPPKGVFNIPSKRRLEVLADRGFDFTAYPASATYIDLCNICGRENSIGLIIIFAALGVASLTLYPLALWMKRSLHKQAQSDESFCARMARSQPEAEISVAGKAATRGGMAGRTPRYPAPRGQKNDPRRTSRQHNHRPRGKTAKSTADIQRGISAPDFERSGRMRGWHTGSAVAQRGAV